MYPAQQNATDQTANFFWLLVLIVGAILAVWWLYRDAIVVPVYLMRYYEIVAIKYVYSTIAPLLNLLHLPTFNIANLDLLQHHILQTNPHTEPMKDFTQLNSYVGDIVRYPVSLLLIAMAIFTYFRHSSVRFKSIYSMKTLKNQESQNWVQIKPVLTLDLAKEDIETGPWAMAQLPLDFCKQHDMLAIEIQGDKKTWQIMRGKAHRVFAMQLGPLWRGVDTLPLHIKALLVIFIARAERDRECSKKLLRQIAASAASGRLDFNGVDDLIQRYRHSKALLWLEKRHAYVYTLMASLLEIARGDGVLATSEFLWLKPLDRRLWYVLNTIGRQTVVVEAAGSFAHWLAERKLKIALKTPMVKEAVNGLEAAVKEALYVEEGEKWHTSNAA